MDKYPEEMIEGIRFVFEDIDNDTTYQGMRESITWKQLKLRLLIPFTTKQALSKLTKAGIKRIEIGSIAWFHYRNKRKGQFVTLNTMFLARLLKR